MLWTFQGRFRLVPKMIDGVKNSRRTDVILSASSDVRDPRELWMYLVHEEAAQVPFSKHGHCIIDPGIAAECVLYALKQSWIGSRIVDYDWAVHTSNYWICDGIIPLTDIDKALQIGNVLQHEMPLLNIDTRLNNDESVVIASYHLAMSAECMSYWISTTTSTSGFVVSPSGVIPENMFWHSHRLGVIKLSRCTFSFSSPPFLCCHSFRFLWLDNCQDLLTGRSTIDPHHTEANKELGNNTMTSWECFQSLWVLDLRYTDLDQIMSPWMMDLMSQLRELNVMGAKSWDMSHIRGWLRNVRKLRVTKSNCWFNNDVFSEMESMELLEFSGNTIREGMTNLSASANNSRLKIVTIDGCDELNIISLRDCKEFNNLFMKRFSRVLEVLDLSGTSLKTLNLEGVEDRSLPKRIILLGCEKLRAILWPLNVEKGRLREIFLHVDTTSPSTSAYGGEAPFAHPHADQSLQRQKEEKYKCGWQFSLMDTRLLRSLSPVRIYLKYSSIHMDIFPTANVGGRNIQETSSDTLVQVQPHTSNIMDSKYRDALKEGPIAAMMMWDCPEIYIYSRLSVCSIKMIMHGQGNILLQDAPSASSSALLLPDFVCEMVISLHVYDNASITSVPSPPKGSGWNRLRWCRIERCPKLHTVFIVPRSPDILETFWASQLLSACYIWGRPVISFFRFMRFLHLDHCPRLVHVFPFTRWESNFSHLQTLEIVYCVDLRERICGRRIFAPKLETIKIRGCWSFRCLPFVGHDTKPPKVDCEKEWWDNLEWDGLEKYHHPSLYELTHSLYYKAKLPRGNPSLHELIFSFRQPASAHHYKFSSKRDDLSVGIQLMYHELLSAHVALVLLLNV
ncbi:hypothetical protein VPH35_108008 [Triticum aestivum]